MLVGDGILLKVRSKNLQEGQRVSCGDNLALSVLPGGVRPRALPRVTQAQKSPFHPYPMNNLTLCTKGDV